MILKYIKNNKGLTLLELLAVVVILAIVSIISAIAILGVIANTKKDAHVANAILLANAAKSYMTAKQIHMDSNKITFSLQKLIEEGYINPIIDPHSNDYYDANETTVTIKKSGDKYEYTVALKRQNSNFFYTKDAKEVFSLTRDDIHTP